MNTSPAKPMKLSVNALLVSPLRVRWEAACGLWRYHGCWRLPAIRQRIKAELHLELSETMPIVLILSLIAAIMIFIVLPSSLREQAETILTNLWPIWVVQAAPMVCAQVLALLNAPAMALRYVELQGAQTFAADSHTRDRQVAALALPQIFAHGFLCAACACLLVMFTLVFGIIAELVLAVGDLRSVLTTILASTSPLAWMRSIGQAFVLGAVCALSAVLFAWPGSQSAANAKDTHRIGIFAMICASAACALAGVAMNWLAGLLGWSPSAI
ncbi:hypothetical protein [Variovorax sp. PCZ-1]|uniref:hypothetical protein n=1 Tax=Variovorax sp. PCZ-1 TaxID=2835533 RepID=UPI001BCB7213|nr:hypothetical protein [Variovorax sp. PCZ-1]MBS7808700.1 hypothetical protein [Variovorax sp. PCZ-1]